VACFQKKCTEKSTISYDFEQPSWHDIYVYQANESIGNFKTCGSMKPRKIIEIIHGILELKIKIII
jgi:hypothetical protein